MFIALYSDIDSDTHTEEKKNTHNTLRFIFCMQFIQHVSEISQDEIQVLLSRVLILFRRVPLTALALIINLCFFSQNLGCVD